MRPLVRIAVICLLPLIAILSGCGSVLKQRLPPKRCHFFFGADEVPGNPSDRWELQLVGGPAEQVAGFRPLLLSSGKKVWLHESGGSQPARCGQADLLVFVKSSAGIYKAFVPKEYFLPAGHWGDYTLYLRAGGTLEVVFAEGTDGMVQRSTFAEGGSYRVMKPKRTLATVPFSIAESLP